MANQRVEVWVVRHVAWEGATSMVLWVRPPVCRSPTHRPACSTQSSRAGVRLTSTSVRMGLASFVMTHAAHGVQDAGCHLSETG